MIPLPATLPSARSPHVPIGVIVVDMDGRVVCMNDAGTRLSAEIVRAGDHGASGGPSNPAITAALLPHWTSLVCVLAGQAVPDVDYVLGLQGEMRHRVVQVAITALRDGSAPMTGAVLTLTDLILRDVHLPDMRGDEVVPLIRDAQGQDSSMLSTGTDITARQQADEARLFLAAIVVSSEDAIIGKTLDGTIVSWNGGAEAIYGYTAAEVVGRSLSLLVPPDRPDELPGSWRACARERASPTTTRCACARMDAASMCL